LARFRKYRININEIQMNRRFKSILTFSFYILFVVIFSSRTWSAPPSKSKTNLWSASVSTGVAFLTREITKDYKLIENEFQHQPGWAIDLNIGRTVGNHWEPMLKGGMYNLHGKSDSPDFSAVGNHASLRGPLFNIPVQYDTFGGNVSGVIRYYFWRFYNQNGKVFRLDPFVEAGAGINIFSTELRYQNPPTGTSSTVIFQKGVDNNQTIANVAQIIFGLGTKIGNPKKWHGVISYNAEIVNYAVLDAVHNYSGTERNHAKGIISKITAGVVFPIATAASGGGRTPVSEHYPWSP
jgi:hypothetical protein